VVKSHISVRTLIAKIEMDLPGAILFGNIWCKNINLRWMTRLSLTPFLFAIDDVDWNRKSNAKLNLRNQTSNNVPQRHLKKKEGTSSQWILQSFWYQNPAQWTENGELLSKKKLRRPEQVNLGASGPRNGNCRLRLKTL